jgi:BirA family transcriptional regulator, biotin operon repressor / biotin---[acetyl-CoA-carboxylase] ligase
MFNTYSFKKKLQTRWVGKNFIFRQQTKSTNSDLKSMPADELINGSVLLADFQLKGRGQYDRDWHAEPGKNLTFTIAFCPEMAERLSLLTLSVGWAIIRVLNGQYKLNSRLKFPNDVIISGKKAAGILTENIFNGSRLERVLIGIGLNVNQENFPAELPNAVSLCQVLEKTVDREELLCRLLESIELVYSKWDKKDPELVKEVSRMISGFGQWVSITINGKPEPDKVKFLGINGEGHLLIFTKELQVKIITHEQIRFHPDNTAG